MYLYNLHDSKHKGQAVSAFPDVCKAPSPKGPLPIAYSNIAMTNGGKKPGTGTRKTTATKAAVSKGSIGNEAAVLRGQMRTLHRKLMTMPADDATQWHRLLDDYVMKTAEVYTTLASKK